MKGRLIIVLMFAICCSIGCFGLSLRMLGESNWTRATGTVVKVENHTVESGERLYVTYSYSVKEKKYQSTEDFGNPEYVKNSPEIGDSLDVTYKPDAPEESRLGGSKSMIFAFIFGIVGLCSLGAVPVVWSLLKRKL